MTDGIEIRTATSEDAEALGRYASRLFAEAPPGIFRRGAPSQDEERAFIHSRTSPPNCTLLLACDGDEIVGSLDLLGGASLEERHAGTFGVSVDSAYRDRGIGTALIERMLVWARDSGMRRVQAWVWSNNPRALSLYERLGFVREGCCREAVRVDGEYIDAHVVARLIAPEQEAER